MYIDIRDYYHPDSFFKPSLIFKGCQLHSHFVREKTAPLNYFIIEGGLKLTSIMLLWRLESVLSYM